MEKLTKREIETIVAEQNRLDYVASSLTAAERWHIMDMGYYNSAIKGYLLRAMAGFDDEAISKVLGGLRWALDELSAEEAAKLWDEY